MAALRDGTGLGTAERTALLDRFQRELDAAERRAPMEHRYERIAPYIVDLDQPGARVAQIIYHRESEARFAAAGPDTSFAHLLSNRALRPGDTVFDLGCNSGFTTSWYALSIGPRGKVFGFDPLPWNAIATRYCAELNGLRNVEVLQVDVGSTEESKGISFREAKTSRRDGTALPDVSVAPLTRFASYRPDVIRIDIDGAEYELSQTDFSLFDRLRLCLLELHPELIEQRGLSPHDCLDNFARSGFSILRDLADPRSVREDPRGAPLPGVYYLQRPVASPLRVAARRTLSPLLRWTPSGRLRSMLSERDRTIRDREATVRERESVIRERERTIREQQEALAAQAAVLSSGEGRIGDLEAHLAKVRGEDEEDRAAMDARASLATRIKAALPRIDGWCTERKALWLADLITRDGCREVLEIGIYGGSSFIPMALAVQSLGAGGKAYGVEAWSNAVAVATETNAVNDDWWRSVDMKAIKTGFLRSVIRNDVADAVVVIEMASDQAFAAISAAGLGPFGLVHVDGSHSEFQALRDVELWSTLVRPGGILVLDDICWPSVLAARDHVRNAFTTIDEVNEAEFVAYGAYRRGPASGITSSPS